MATTAFIRAGGDGVRNQAEGGAGVRRSTIGGRRSEVGGQAWGRSEDLAKLLATPRATRRCPLFARSGIGRTSKSNRSRTSDLSDGVRGSEKTCIGTKGSVAGKGGA